MKIESIQTNNVQIGDTSIQNFSSMLTGNYIINGNFNVWQRGASFSSSGYTADRWDGGNIDTASAQASTITSLPNITVMQFGSNTTSHATLTQSIESFDVLDLPGNKVTISFWARAVTGCTSNTFQARLLYPDSQDDWASTNTIESFNIWDGGIADTNWRYYTFTSTAVMPSEVSRGLRLMFYTTNDTVNHTMEIAQVKLEKGEMATPFIGRPMAQELLLCQRTGL